MIYIDQNSTELKLSLTINKFNKEPLQVISTKEIIMGGFNIEFGILGASHFVTFKKDDFLFSEIFACVELDGVDSIKNIDSLKLERENYSFSSSIKSWSEDGESAYNNAITKANTFPSLEFIFPSEKEGFFQARTNISISILNDYIVIDTIHAYPNENNVVVTKSTMKI